MKINVVGDHEIEKAVAVVVAEGGSGGPAAVGDAGPFGDVGEGAVAVVAIKNISTEAGDVQIGPTVIVVIADGAAHGETGSGEASLGGDVGEGSVAIVAIKSAEAFLALDGHVHGRSVGEIDVRPSIAVVIHEKDTATHGLDDVLALRRGSVQEADACFFRDINKLWNRTADAADGFDSGGRRRRFWMSLLTERELSREQQ